jgi:hypothetical protein
MAIIDDKGQMAKIKMTTQNANLSVSALSFCTFIFSFCILLGSELSFGF